jgi:hypothetical protein
MNTTTKVAIIPTWQNLSLENLENEQWKPIKNFEENYMISNMGRIKYLNYLHHKGKTHNNNGSLLSNGYLKTVLTNNVIKKQFLVHRLVALNFIENPLKKKVVNHINGIKTDNRVENLEWCTYFENTKHASKKLKVITDFSPIIQLNTKYEFIKKWRSLSEIQNKTGMSKGNISKHLKGHKRYNTAYEHIWMIEADYYTHVSLKTLQNIKSPLKLTT